jgi:23S rRNA pseudouridine1911/1915/1917 synthase
MHTTARLVIGPEDLTLIRADRVLAACAKRDPSLAGLSRSQIQRMMDENKVLLDGVPVHAQDVLSVGDTITIEWAEPVQMDVLPENIPISVLYEDEHLIIVNKAANQSVHPSPQETSGTLVNALLFHIRDLSGIGGVLRPGIVHRIDKNTTGALVVAKNDATHQGLAKLFSSHTIDRSYWAFCYASPLWESETVKNEIDRNPKDRKKMTVVRTGGRVAITHLKRIESYGRGASRPFASLIEANLETGRTHQVRVHLTQLGNSLLGDPIYGAPTAAQGKWVALPKVVQDQVRTLPGQALHARTLGFVHPISGKKIFVEAPLPEHLSQLASILKDFV